MYILGKLLNPEIHKTVYHWNAFANTQLHRFYEELFHDKNSHQWCWSIDGNFVEYIRMGSQHAWTTSEAERPNCSDVFHLVQKCFRRASHAFHLFRTRFRLTENNWPFELGFSIRKNKGKTRQNSKNKLTFSITWTSYWLFIYWSKRYARNWEKTNALWLYRYNNNNNLRKT